MSFLESLGFADVAEAPPNRHVDFWATRGGARCGITIRNGPFTGYEAMSLAERARDGGFQPVVVPRAGVRGDVAAWSTRLGLEVVPEATLHAFEAAVAAEEAALAEERRAALEAAIPPEGPAVAPALVDPYVLGELGVVAAAHAAELLRIESALADVWGPEPEPVPAPAFDAPEHGLTAATALWEMPLLPVHADLDDADEDEVLGPVAADLPWEPVAARAPPAPEVDASGLPWDARPAAALPWAAAVDADPAVVQDVAQAYGATRALGRFLAKAVPDPRVTLNDPDLWGTRDRLADIRGRLNHENVALSVDGVKSNWLKRVADDEES